MKTGMMMAAAVAAVLVAGSASAVRAATVDFESGGYSLAADGNGSATLSTAQAQSGTHSILLSLPTNTTTDFAKIIINEAPGALQLGNASGTFATYVPSGQQAGATYAPYIYFMVDTNGLGTANAFVLAFFTPTLTNDQWTTLGLNDATKVFVSGARPGLASNTYNSTNGQQDTLASLNALSTGLGGTWGDLDVLQVRVGVGETGGNIAPFEAYVDDINVVNAAAVPLPAAAWAGLMLLGGLGAVSALKRARRVA